MKQLIRNFFTRPNLIPFLIAATISLLIVMIAVFQPYVPAKQLLRDDQSITPSVGLISYIGCFIWLSASVVCFFTLSLLGKEAKLLPHKKIIRFAGILTMILFLDDFFRLHETIWPDLSGLSEEYFYVVYIIAAAIYFYLYRKTVSAYTPLLFSALFFLAWGLLGDVFGMGTVFEDSMKFIGINLWFAFHATYCRYAIQS